MQIATVEHLLDNIAAAHEFLIDVQLWNGWPVRVRFDAFTNLLVFQDVDRGVVGYQGIEDAHGGRGKSALRLLWRAFHEQHHAIRTDKRIDALARCFV